MTFGWDSTDATEGELQDFIAYGFEVEHSVVLTLKKSQLVHPKHQTKQLLVRPLKSDDDWQQAIENQLSCRQADFKLEMYIPFKTEQMNKFRKMSESGLGEWFGAFLNGKLVGDCGVYTAGDVARYQAVGTHPDFRRQGVCANLVYESAKYAFEKMNAETVVMVADPEYHAAKVYESVGFMPTEKSIGMYWYPKEEWKI